jgi:hypothetical protein
MTDLFAFVVVSAASMAASYGDCYASGSLNATQ